MKFHCLPQKNGSKTTKRILMNDFPKNKAHTPSLFYRLSAQIDRTRHKTTMRAPKWCIECNDLSRQSAKNLKSTVIKENPDFGDFTLRFINIFYHLAHNRDLLFTLPAIVNYSTTDRNRRHR